MIQYLYNETENYKEALYNYLLEHNADFPIPLSDKVDLKKYVKKINEFGKSIICTNENKIIGVLLYYDNDLKERCGFLSVLSVDRKYQRQGIAKRMLNDSFRLLKKNNMISYKIPTHVTNLQAINLYHSLGFNDYEKDSNTIYLIKSL